MKRLLLILPVLLIVGCSKEPINYETTLVERYRVFYTKDTNKPYSGPIFSLFEDGKKKEEGSLKDGERDGKYTGWYSNGQKYERTYKDGVEDGLFTQWYSNGKKYKEGTYKDRERDGVWTEWLNNGQKVSEATYKDGELDGLWTIWYKNGQKKNGRTYKVGELISKKCWDVYGNEIECN